MQGNQTTKEFGETLKKLRTEKGMKQKELADKSGIQYSRLRSIEAGSEKSVGPKTRQRLLEVLGMAGVHNSTVLVGDDSRVIVSPRTNASSNNDKNLWIKIAKCVLSEDFKQDFEVAMRMKNIDEDRAILFILENMMSQR